MGFATSTVKYVLFIFNLLCALIGIAIIAIGGIFMNNISSFKEFTESLKAMNIPIVIIVLGGLIFIIAFFGCCGAIRESHCMTITYSVFLFVLLVLQIIAVIFLFVSKEALKNELRNNVQRIWDRASDNKQVMDTLQQGLHCCGANGPGDYSYIFIPKSCCPNPDSITSCITPYTASCKDALAEKAGWGTDLLAYVGLGVFVVELVGFIFACCLANNIRNHKRRSTY